MRLLQPLPSEIGPAGPGVGDELQLDEAKTCLKDGKVRRGFTHQYPASLEARRHIWC